MKHIGFVLLIFQLFITNAAFSQQNTDTNIATGNSNQLVVHTVVKGETIYSICRKYEIDEKELLAANPNLANGLKTGDLLHIPKRKTPETNAAIPKPEHTVLHTVKKGETLYSISRIYNISTEAIIKQNPEASQILSENQLLKIPTTQANTTTITSHSNNKKHFIHTIEEGDTFYSFLRRFGVSREEIIELNPETIEGLKVGQTIKITSKEHQPERNEQSAKKHIEHHVEPGETIYGIASYYGVKVYDVMEINQELKEKGLISGSIILIPTPSSGENKTVISKQTKNGQSVPNYWNTENKTNIPSETFRITMFLPLFLDQNDSINAKYLNQTADSLQNVKQALRSSNRSLYNQSRNFVYFYEGFLLALDSMKKTGVKIEVDLFDNQAKQTVVDNQLRDNELANSNLIIGPVDIKHQRNISNFSFKNQIPLVSPFAAENEHINNNPFYFQINPTKDYVLKKTADYISETYYNKNVIVMVPPNQEQIKSGDVSEYIKERIKALKSKYGEGNVQFSKISITDAGNKSYWHIKDVLKKDAENIVFLVPTNSRTDKEIIISKAINSLYVLSENYQITLIGMNDYPNYKSINTEYFHKLNLHFITPNHIDYKDAEVNCFLKKYRENFNTEPNQFSYRGYDIGKYFIEAYKSGGKNYTNKISSFEAKTLQTSLKFKRVKDFSGFVNHSLFVVNYSPDFNLNVVKIMKE
jgi:LysM repeat protein/ABC-type branched-subunit amino acid transport system substrate-binding protein